MIDFDTCFDLVAWTRISCYHRLIENTIFVPRCRAAVDVARHDLEG